MNILGLIPARGGSKGIPHKNIVPLAGKPLIAHTIQAALGSRYLSRVMVSTDDAEIAEVARQWGAEVPFLRPTEFAGDASPAIEVMQHAIKTLANQENWQADIVVYLQPTSPLRQTRHIDDCIELQQGRGAETVVSVVEVPHQYSPHSVLSLADGVATPFLPSEEAALRRQDKPKFYARNGPAVLVITAKRIMQEGQLYGEKTYAYEMEQMDSIDIDSPFDLELAEWLLSR